MGKTKSAIFIDVLPTALRCNLRNPKTCLIGYMSLVSSCTSCLFLDFLGIFLNLPWMTLH